MMRIASLFAVAALVCGSSIARAEDAATSALPAALQSLGAESSVVSTVEADQVRGQGGFKLTQDVGFWIKNGTAVGSVTLLEGVLGNFAYDDGQGFQAGGVFGGLSGSIGADDGSLNFQLGGKALQQNFDFVGDFSQDFKQWFGY